MQVKTPLRRRQTSPHLLFCIRWAERGATWRIRCTFGSTYCRKAATLIMQTPPSPSAVLHYQCAMCHKYGPLYENMTSFTKSVKSSILQIYCNVVRGARATCNMCIKFSAVWTSFFWTSSQKNDKVLLTTYAICSRLFYLIAFLLYPPSFPFCLASLPGSKLQQKRLPGYSVHEPLRFGQRT